MATSKDFDSVVDEALVEAADSGDLVEVKRLLDAGADCERRDAHGKSALGNASFHGHLTVVTELIRSGAAVNAVANLHGGTALHLASFRDHVDTARALLEAGAGINTADNRGHTALHKASSRGQVDIARALLEAGAHVNTADRMGQTALHLASRRGQVDIARALLEAGAHVNTADRMGQTALHLASRRGEMDIARALLEAGAHINTADDTGGTALHEASHHGQVDVARVLLEAGAHVNTADCTGVTALHKASRRGQVDIARALLEAGAHINTAAHIGVTALHLAAGSGEVDIARVLLEAGAHINATDSIRATPLMDAAEYGQANAVTLLLQKGSDTQKKNMFGKTALMLAERRGHTKVVELLNLHERGEKLPTLTPQTPADEEMAEKERSEKHGTKDLRGLEWDPNKVWSDQEKVRLLQACIMRILLAGTFENGKSSLARSLLNNTAQITNIDDRTVVVDFQPWQVDDHTTVTLYDLGGHQCYQAIAHLFFADAANNLAIIVHKITSTQYSNTWKWITDILTHAPGCAILLALTMIDLVDEEDLQSKKEQFKKELIDRLQIEVEMLKLNCTDDKRKIVQRLEQLSADIKDETIIYTLSCVSGFGLSKLQEGLYKMMKDGQFKVEITEYAFLLYTDIGVIGKAIEEKELQVSKNADSIQKAKKSNRVLKMLNLLASKLKIKKSTTQPQPVALSSSDRLTEKNNYEQEEQQPSKLKYIEKSEVMQKFNTRYSASVNSDQLNDILNSSLAKLHSLGLIQWYNTPTLQHFIFNDLLSFINMLKCIFQHDIKLSLGIDKVPTPMKQMILQHGTTKYEQYLQTLCSQGLLSQELLKILASQFGFENNCDILVKLLSHLELIYPIAAEEESTGNQENWLFFPHYVDSVEIPPNVIDQLQNLTLYEKGYFTFHGSIKGYIPSSFFNLLCVGIYKLLLSGVYDQMREVWKHNLFAKVGDTRFHLEHIKNNHTQEGIAIKIKCKLKQCSVSKVWEIVKETHKETEKLKKTWWPGLVTDSTLSCPHCGMKGTATQCKNWPLVDVVHRRGIPGEVCSCSGDGHQSNFPQVLLYPLPQDTDKAEKCIQELYDYMEVNCNEDMQTFESNEGPLPGPNGAVPKLPKDDNISRTPPYAAVSRPLKEDMQKFESNEGPLPGPNVAVPKRPKDGNISKTLPDAAVSRPLKEDMQKFESNEGPLPGPNVAVPKRPKDGNISKIPPDAAVSRPLKVAPVKEDVSKYQQHDTQFSDDETETSVMRTYSGASTSKDTEDVIESEKPLQVNLTSNISPSDITEVTTLECRQVETNQLQVLSTQMKEMEDRLMQRNLVLSHQLYLQGKFHAEQADTNKIELAMHADQNKIELAVHADQNKIELAVHADQNKIELAKHADQNKIELAVHADQNKIELAEHADQNKMELSNKVALDAGDASALENNYTHPVLQTNKSLLEQRLCVTYDLLSKLFIKGLLWKDQMKKIQKQESESGQRKLLLLFLDRNLVSSDGDLDFDDFMDCCVNSDSPANIAMVKRINYD